MLLRYTLFTILSIFLFSCEKYELPIYVQVDGFYSLQRVSCFCDSPTNPIANQYQCKLDLDKKLLSVIIFGENPKPIFLDPGEYNVSVNKDVITIEGIRYGFRMSENSLSFDTGSAIGIADFPVYTFVK